MLVKPILYAWFWPVVQAIIAAHEYVTEDGSAVYVTENGLQAYVNESF